MNKVRQTHVQHTIQDEQHSASKLLKAALVVFSESGFHGATTKEIAKVAQVNESLITRHFQSKQGLFLAVIEKNMIEARSSLSYPLAKTIEDELIAFSDSIIDVSIKNLAFSRMVLSHALQNSSFADSMKNQIKNVGASLIGERLAKVAKNEGLPEFDYKMVEGIVHKITYVGTLYSALLSFQDVEISRKSTHEQVRFFWASLRKSLIS